MTSRAGADTGTEPQAIEVDTSQGLARVHLRPAPTARGALVLGHGAGGGVSAPICAPPPPRRATRA